MRIKSPPPEGGKEALLVLGRVTYNRLDRPEGIEKSRFGPILHCATAVESSIIVVHFGNLPWKDKILLMALGKETGSPEEPLASHEGGRHLPSSFKTRRTSRPIGAERCPPVMMGILAAFPR